MYFTFSKFTQCMYVRYRKQSYESAERVVFFFLAENVAGKIILLNSGNMQASAQERKILSLRQKDNQA